MRNHSVNDRNGTRLERRANGQSVVRAMVDMGVVQSDEEMLSVFRRIGLNGPGLSPVLDKKMLVRYGDHGQHVGLSDRIPGIETDALSLYEGSVYDEESAFQVEVIEEKAVTYKLSSIFNDVPLTDKLQLSPRRLQAAKRLALADPAAAAASLMEYLRNNGFPLCRVIAGDYAKTAANCCNYIRALARKIVYQDNMAPAQCTPTQLMISYDAFKGGESLWTVIGPVKYATEVLAIYQLSIHYGPEEVMFMVGVETAALEINTRNDLTGDYFTGKVHGYSSLSGIQPMRSGYPSELTAVQQQRLAAAAQKVMPVFVDDAVIGSAVQISDRHAILNEHTLVAAADAECVPVLAGVPLHQSRSVASDISVVRCDHTQAQWLLRDAIDGERVVLCYNVGNAVEFSEVLRVRIVTGERLVLTPSEVLRKGASGAAVIALRDSALLGLFATKRGADVICAVVSSSTFSMITELETVMSSEAVPTPNLSSGNRTYDRMVKKGLLSFLTGIEQAAASLYVRPHAGAPMRHVGLVANVAGSWTTTVDPHQSQLMMSDGVPLSFQATSGGYTAVAPPPILQPMPNVRDVVPGERVFLFTKSGTEVAMTAVREVIHSMPDLRQFRVDDFGESDEVIEGGLIVAERDAAVVGQYVSQVIDAFGRTSAHCVSLKPVLAGSAGATAMVDAAALVEEMADWIVQSAVTLGEFALLGRSVLEVAGGQLAYIKGTSVSEGMDAVRLNWERQYERLVESVGWLPSDWLRFTRVDRKLLAECFVALYYLRDPGGFSTRVASRLIVGRREESTPIVGSFPFPRPSSVASVGTVVPVEVGDAESRLRMLELKLAALTGDDKG